MKNMEAKKGFSWMGLLFGGAYYAGYGQLVRGLIMAVISFIPLTALAVNIYAGVKARKQLPVGAQAFEWPKAVMIFFIPVVLSGALLIFMQSGGAKAYSEADFRAATSAYWIVDSSGDEWGFDMQKEPYALILNGRRSPISVVKYTPMDEDGYCFLALRLSNGKLIGLTMAPPDDELLVLSATGAKDDILRFAREL